LLGLGDAMRGAAMPVEEVRKVFADAARQAVRASDSRLLAEAAMRHAGRGPMRVSVLREAGTVHSGEIALLEQALSAVGAGDSAERALLQAWLAYSLYNSERREERKALARSAVQVARRVGDGPVLAECLMLQQHAVRGPAELDARIAALGEILELGRTYDLLGLQFDARCERAWAYWERCMPAEAEADMLEMQRLAESSRQRREKRAAAVWRAMKLDADGRFDDAEAMLAESDRDQPKDGRVNQGRAIRQFMISALRGRSGETLPALEAIAAKFPLPVAWHCGLVSSYASNGRLAEAARELDRLALDDFAAIPDDHNWITSHAQLCGPCRLLGDKARAAVLYRKLLPYADRMCVVGLHGFCGGVTHRALAECAITLGDLDAAERHLARAIEEDTRVGARIWATSGRISHAMLLLERGGRADKARACEQLSAALAYARSRGLSDLVARAEELTESRTRRPLRGSA
jgi:tetratricopeptide (TPR) repeat protein